jgi:hypothetical protein
LRSNAMRVFYRIRGARRAAVTVYEQTAVTFCCAEMERRWGTLIGFGARGCKASTSDTVNLFTDRAQASGKTIPEVTAVAACPWCGEAVDARQEQGGTAARRVATMRKTPRR